MTVCVYVSMRVYVCVRTRVCACVCVNENEKDRHRGESSDHIYCPQAVTTVMSWVRCAPPLPLSCSLPLSFSLPLSECMLGVGREFASSFWLFLCLLCPSTRVAVPIVPPFIPNEALEQKLQRLGRWRVSGSCIRAVKVTNWSTFSCSGGSALSSWTAKGHWFTLAPEIGTPAMWNASGLLVLTSLLMSTFSPAQCRAVTPRRAVVVVVVWWWLLPPPPLFDGAAQILWLNLMHERVPADRCKDDSQRNKKQLWAFSLA